MNTEKQTPKKPKQPVVIYIMILFIAAFLLMALSSLIHQRSNTEALGELQHSLSNMQAVQASQDQIIDLQQQLADAEEAQDTLREELAALEQSTTAALSEKDQAIADAERRTEALRALYTLQQNYLTREHDACMNILQYMEDNALAELLPDKAVDDATPPNLRYLQLREAVLNQK